MKKDPRIFVEHILECIELIEGYVQGVSKKDFLTSKRLQIEVKMNFMSLDAIVTCLIQIG